MSRYAFIAISELVLIDRRIFFSGFEFHCFEDNYRLPKWETKFRQWVRCSKMFKNAFLFPIKILESGHHLEENISFHKNNRP